ncbi:MAG: DUF389 domain-containing protein [Fuerstiella sp.]
MTTVLIVTQPEEVRHLMPWAMMLADSRGSELAVVVTQRKKGDTRLSELPIVAASNESELAQHARSAILARTQSGNFPDSPASGHELSEDEVERTIADAALPFHLPARLYQLSGENWAAAISHHISELTPTLLVVPAPAIARDGNVQQEWQSSLLNAPDCDVVLMRDDAVAVTGQLSVAVFLRDHADNEKALSYSANLAARFEGKATAVYIEPAIGDDAESIGRRQVDADLNRLLSPRLRHLFTSHVIVASSEELALQQIKPGDYDLLIFGTRDLKEMRRFLQASPVGGAETLSSLPAVAVLHRGVSFSGYLRNSCDNWLRSFIPQLSREERINLVSRIQTSSQWDFDFVCLISLATMIACLGLAENSGAVIVGAMLVAPLMTPIAGVGLGVAHANAYLTKVAFRTALKGFATAILLGVMFGIVVQGCAKLGWLAPLANPAPTISEFAPTAAKAFPTEMENRMRPQFYDLLIALASGVAAAYAMGRPNLYSALPGVAIAAALVPPIATSGIAFAHGEFTRGAGALLLFLTNMVTIILGTSMVFRAVGIRSQKAGPNAARWPRYTLFTLVVLSVLITIVIELKNRSAV